MKKFNTTYKLIKKHGFANLKNFGFEHPKVCGGCSVLINKKLRVVAKKRSDITLFNDIRMFDKKDLIPMVFIRHANKKIKYIIQCLADTTPKKRCRAKRILNRKYPGSNDLHTYNVGYYRNKPVIFDW